MSHINFTLCFVYMRLRVCASYIQLDQNKCPFTHRAAAPEPSIDAKHRAHTTHQLENSTFFRSFFISFLLSETYILFGCNMFSRALSLSLSLLAAVEWIMLEISKQKRTAVAVFTNVQCSRRGSSAHKQHTKTAARTEDTVEDPQTLSRSLFFSRCVSDMWRKLFN